MKILTVNDNSLNWEKNMTINVNVILKKMNYTFKMLVVKVNGKLIKKTEYSTIIIPVAADVKIIHLISGG
jgi:thiamine biosynthesis protein ThiS